jgi:hypothetical protein
VRKRAYDPRIDPLADWNALASRWCRMASHDHPNVRESFTKWKPATIKQFDHLITTHPTYW